MESIRLFTRLDDSVPAPSLMAYKHLAVLLILGDLLGILLSLHLTYFIQFGQPYHLVSASILGIITLTLIVFYIGDAYRPELKVAGLLAPTRTLICCLLLGLLIAAFSYLFRTTELTQLAWRSVLLPGLGIFTGWAILLRTLACTIAKAHAKQVSCLLLGADDGTLRFEQDFTAWNPQGKLVILSNAPNHPCELSKHSESLQGSLADLSLWSAPSWSGIVVNSHLKLANQETRQLMQLRFQGIPIYQLPNFYETFLGKLPSKFLQDNWLAFGNGFDLVANRASLNLKRVIDLIIVTVLSLSLLPVFTIVALAIKCDSRGSIFYSQLRNGQNATPFRVYKFRSMRQDAEKQGAQWAQKRDPRVTRVGYWLRLTRIDELPQLWNVLKGDMSLIGPRPERPEFDLKLAEQIPYYNLRYLVKPGITGWAQVMYPYGASVEDTYEKLSYDLYYIKNYSIWLDFKIVFKTVRVVLLGKGR